MKTNSPLTWYNRIIKRSFDLILSLLILILTAPIIVIAYIIATIDTGENGFFTQNRVGKDGEIFKIIKIRTMKTDSKIKTNVTTDADSRITKTGKLFRKLKLDELPQLINVVKGDMSFVGPRPDVPELIDELDEEDKIILSVRPGITGPATIKYKNEEEILAEVDNPEEYNREVLFPDKIEINKEYIRNYSFLKDLQYMLQTIFN